MRLRVLTPLVALALVVAGCGDDDDDDAGATDATKTTRQEVTIKLVTHDSFNVTEDVLAAFTEETGITVEIVPSGDAGAALNASILNKDVPLGDVFFGVDNTFLTRALDEDLFVPYEAEGLESVPEELVLDDEHRVTPIDHGDVCVNYDKDAFESAPVPKTFDDLADPSLRSKLVVENPATSSPGLAFLLGTIAEFGEDGWQDYWRSLRENDVQVASGWEEAYYGSFSGGAGEGDRPLVVSYATSPPAEVVFADPPVTEAPTGVVESTCFGQIEFAGILRGTEHEDAAKELIDFMLSEPFQADMPLQMFVFPVVEGVELPDAFTEYAAQVEEPLSLPLEEIGANRDRWIDEWTEIVLD